MLFLRAKYLCLQHVQFFESDGSKLDFFVSHISCIEHKSKSTGPGKNNLDTKLLEKRSLLLVNIKNMIHQNAACFVCSLSELLFPG